MPSTSTDLWGIVFLSLRVSATAVLLGSLVGVPFGVWLGLIRPRAKSWVTVLVHTGMALPPVLVGLGLYLLLSRSGPLASLGWLFTPSAMITAQTLLALPLIVGISMNAVASVHPDLFSQIRGLGGSEWQCRWTVFREARQGLLLALAVAFGRSISEVGAVLMVGGNIEGETRVLTTAIVLETSKGSFHFALLLGAVLLTIALLVNLAIVSLHGMGTPR
jgi:tungstate transport system permease protein